jgi:hypothetical protein
MVTISARKRIESIEKVVIPAMFVGMLSKDDAWLKHTLEETLPMLEARALRLAEECKKNGECQWDDTICDKVRISKMFKDTRKKLEKENVVRKSRSRYHH